MILMIEKDNVKMEYFKFGSGNKTMILLPGVSIKSVMESEMIVSNAYSNFSKDFTVYVFDRKKNMKSGYSIFDMADDTIRVIEKLGLKDIYLAGASQGAMIASVISYKRPDLIKKLSINSVTAKVRDEYYSFFLDMINKTKNNELNLVVDSFMKNVYSKELYEASKDSMAPFIESITEYDKNSFIIQCEALKDFDILDNIKNIKCETLIIAGKLDLVFDYNDSKNISKLIKNSKLYIYDNYGHALYDEAPDFKERVYDFFLS